MITDQRKAELDRHVSIASRNRTDLITNHGNVTPRLVIQITSTEEAAYVIAEMGSKAAGVQYEFAAFGIDFSPYPSIKDMLVGEGFYGTPPTDAGA